MILVLIVIGYFVWGLLLGVREEHIVEQQPTGSETIYDTPPPSDEEVANWTVEPDRPRYMTIPAIGMHNARVEALGLVADSDQLAAPDNIWNVGWYINSAKPGVNGTGLYDCHTFFNADGGLCDAMPNAAVSGTEITIERGDGAKLVYGVVENKTMTVEEANEYMSILLQPPAGAKQSISIITCSGKYNLQTQTSSHRTVIRAILKQGP
jgi:hypothetical protein